MIRFGRNIMVGRSAASHAKVLAASSLLLTAVGCAQEGHGTGTRLPSGTERPRLPQFCWIAKRDRWFESTSLWRRVGRTFHATRGVGMGTAVWPANSPRTIPGSVGGTQVNTAA